jgi:DNA-binding response OmpR family regulator
MTKILVCEDDNLIRFIIERVLSAQNYQVTPVANGELAIQELKENSYDLVISDTIMPVSTGLDVINFIRNELHSDVPVLIMSGQSESIHVQEAKKIGASDYLAKPFAAFRLQRKVAQLLQSHNSLQTKENHSTDYNNQIAN